jgi:hypothetical protein
LSATEVTLEYKTDALLELMIEIRKDMCGAKSKISKYDLLLNLMQDSQEVENLWKEMQKIK